jgi:hypothetical protein
MNVDPQKLLTWSFLLDVVDKPNAEWNAWLKQKRQEYD